MITGKPLTVNKTWGKEVWLVNNEKEDYCSKILYIEAGKNTSMHFHALKHETFYVQEGTLRVDLLNTLTCEVTTVRVAKGETLEIDRIYPHKLIAEEEDVALIETSTFHRDEDSYRVWR